MMPFAPNTFCARPPTPAELDRSKFGATPRQIKRYQPRQKCGVGLVRPTDGAAPVGVRYARQEERVPRSVQAHRICEIGDAQREVLCKACLRMDRGSRSSSPD